MISDIHGNLPALEAVLASIAARGITRIVNLGDHVSGPLWPRETAVFLMRHSWPSIRGNHDRMVACDAPATHGPSDRFAFAETSPDQRAWLATQPPALTLDDDGLFLCHGIPTDDRMYLLETPEAGRLRLAAPEQIARRLGLLPHPLVVCGHSHIARAVHLGEILIVNPGSVGLPAYTHDGAHAHASETGSPLARYAVVEQVAGRPSVTFVAVDYEFETAARRAEANGRPDWAVALRTGYVSHA